VIHFGVEATVHEVRGFFVKAAYIIDGLRFSADDIEHGILRANAGNPAIPGPQFRFHDPRFALVISQVDPRIHFTLVCASESCPPVGIYSPEQLDQQLDLAAHNFINGGEVRVDLERNEVHLSRIFQWYAPDFGGNVLNQIGQGSFRNVLAYIARYIADDEAQQALLRHPDRFKVRFNKYDWGLNLVA
jgi:hypothetical protein